MASRPDEVIAAQSYANSIPHIELLKQKRKEIDREIEATLKDQENSALILRRCVNLGTPTKLYTIAGNKFLLVNWIPGGSDLGEMVASEFQVISPENIPAPKPQQPMAEPYQSGRRIPPVVRGVADEILARLPADMKVGREIVQEAAEACAEPTAIVCKGEELETARELVRATTFGDPDNGGSVLTPSIEEDAEAEMIDHG